MCWWTSGIRPAGAECFCSRAASCPRGGRRTRPPGHPGQRWPGEHGSGPASEQPRHTHTRTHQVQTGTPSRGPAVSSTGGRHRGSRTRKRGRRGGIRLKMRGMSLSHIPLPSIVLSNVQSLQNKTEELQAQARYRHEFRDACILALTETWLSHKDLDKDVTIDGFGKLIRLDRGAVATGKSTGGGLCLFLNERYCDAKSVIIRERLCTADLELLSISLCPRYLPREFPWSVSFLGLFYVCVFLCLYTPRLQPNCPSWDK